MNNDYDKMYRPGRDQWGNEIPDSAPRVKKTPRGKKTMGKTIKLKDVNEGLAELQEAKAFLESRKAENDIFYQLRPIGEEESILEFRGDILGSAVYHLLQRLRRLEKRVLELEGDL